MEAIPWGFKSPLSHPIVALTLLLACAPSAEETAGRLRAGIEASSGTLSDEVESLLDSPSRHLLREVSNQGWLPEVLQPLKTLLARTRLVPGEPGLLRGDDPAESLYFVRDGYGMHLNLALSGEWFVGLHALRYPRPW